ncbi:MAG: hypothetical protein PF569_02660 [Candidatus Woesearchaeota archaeon]|jgi:hypothetical protein|nr:hypothetical protein [Candidatus Woesearchaeota archaeon]
MKQSKILSIASQEIKDFGVPKILFLSMLRNFEKISSFLYMVEK